MKKSKMRILAMLMAVLLCTPVFSVTAFAGGGPDASEPVAEAPEPEPTIEPGEPFSEGSEFNTRDLLYDKATNKQFITVQGRDGNIFYIIIDYDAPIDEDEEQYQTYFLNQVDEADLEALLEEAAPAACSCQTRCMAGAVNTGCEVCASNMTECVGKEPEPEKPEPTPEPEPEPEKKNNLGGPLALLLIAALAGGGAFYYIKFIKNKPKTKGNTDLDDYDYGDEDELEEDADLAFDDEPEDMEV